MRKEINRLKEYSFLHNESQDINQLTAQLDRFMGIFDKVFSVQEELRHEALVSLGVAVESSESHPPSERISDISSSALPPRFEEGTRKREAESESKEEEELYDSDRPPMTRAPRRTESVGQEEAQEPPSEPPSL